MLKYTNSQIDLTLAKLVGYQSLEHLFDDISLNFEFGLMTQTKHLYSVLTDEGKRAYTRYALAKDPQFNAQLFLKENL